MHVQPICFLPLKRGPLGPLPIWLQGIRGLCRGGKASDYGESSYLPAVGRKGLRGRSWGLRWGLSRFCQVADTWGGLRGRPRDQLPRQRLTVRMAPYKTEHSQNPHPHSHPHRIRCTQLSGIPSSFPGCLDRSDLLKHKKPCGTAE